MLVLKHLLLEEFYLIKVLLLISDNLITNFISQK